MKNLRSKPDSYCKQKNIMAYFGYDKMLSALVKSLKDKCWSQRVKSWIFQQIEVNLNNFYHNPKGEMFIDYSQLKQAQPLQKKTTKH
tara:strand:- start:188 stop:448 length:261 start_codon:yes stop_codon:yes gene_type:complete